jgi:DNA-binding NarL/FixJ family response regulator
MDGLGVLPALRGLLPEARIIVFTGRDDARMRQQALEAGASGWVLKGGDLSGLLDQLGAAMPAPTTPAS